MTWPPAISRRTEYALLGLVVAVQAAICWHFASQSYFVADDFPIFFDAQVKGGFNLGFLGSEVIVHFSPGFRFVSLLIQRYATFDFDLALAFVLACHLAAVVLLERILRFWASPVWALALAFAYGLSIVFMTALQWFSLGLQTLPPVALGLATVHAHLCWHRTRRPAWLVWSVVALGGALLFYEKAVLIPVYLVLIAVLLREPERPVRDCAADVVRDWRVWSLYALPVVVYLAVYATRDHYESWHLVPFDQAVEYLRIAWLDGFVPSVFGIRVTPDSGDLVRTWAVALCQVALLAGVAFSLVRRPSAWRAWLFLIVVFTLNALIVLPRVSRFGTGIGYVLRYNVEVVALAMIAIVCAFAGPRAERARRAGRRHLGRAAAAAGALGLAGYVGLVLTADAAIVRDWPGRFSRAWFDNVHRDLEQIKRSDPRPVLLDDQVPARILPFWIRRGGNRLSTTLPLFIDDLRFDRVSDLTYRIGPDGHVRPVKFRPAAVLPIGRRSCLGSPDRFAQIELRSPHVLRGGFWYLRSRYRTTGPGGLFVLVDRGVGYPTSPDRGLSPRPRGGVALTELGTLLNGKPIFRGLRIVVPSGTRACFERLVIGSYRPA